MFGVCWVNKDTKPTQEAQSLSDQHEDELKKLHLAS